MAKWKKKLHKFEAENNKMKKNLQKLEADNNKMKKNLQKLESENSKMKKKLQKLEAENEAKHQQKRESTKQRGLALLAVTVALLAVILVPWVGSHLESTDPIEDADDRIARHIADIIGFYRAKNFTGLLGASVAACALPDVRDHLTVSNKLDCDLVSAVDRKNTLEIQEIIDSQPSAFQYKWCRIDRAISPETECKRLSTVDTFLANSFSGWQGAEKVLAKASLVLRNSGCPLRDPKGPLVQLNGTAQHQAAVDIIRSELFTSGEMAIFGAFGVEEYERFVKRGDGVCAAVLTKKTHEWFHKNDDLPANVANGNLQFQNDVAKENRLMIKQAFESYLAATEVYAKQRESLQKLRLAESET